MLHGVNNMQHIDPDWSTGRFFFWDWWVHKAVSLFALQASVICQLIGRWSHQIIIDVVVWSLKGGSCNPNDRFYSLALQFFNLQSSCNPRPGWKQAIKHTKVISIDSKTFELSPRPNKIRNETWILFKSISCALPNMARCIQIWLNIFSCTARGQKVEIYKIWLEFWTCCCRLACKSACWLWNSIWKNLRNFGKILSAAFSYLSLSIFVARFSVTNVAANYVT